MNLKSLILSSDEKTVRILRRVLSDLEITVDHCSSSDDAVRRLTRQRFEAIIVDCSDPKNAKDVLLAAKAAPVNKRALCIVLVEANVGLKGGFEMGAHFVLHKPLAVERTKGSFRAVRALMKSERRLQMRVPVQVPVSCLGTGRYEAKTLDLCEGGMAIRFIGRVAKETALRFSLELPGMGEKLEIWGELAWEGDEERAGVRFKNITDGERALLRKWLNNQLAEPVQDDPPLVCRLTDLSLGGCYVTTGSPFPNCTRVILSIRSGEKQVRAGGVVRIAHPEYGMGIEFFQATPEQQDQVQKMIEALRVRGESPELQVEPDGLEAASPEEVLASASTTRLEDALVELFRQPVQVPAEEFMLQMKQQRNLQETSH
jgi:hypothetical protein